MNLETAKKLIDKHAHWHHKFEIAPGLMTPGSYDPRFMMEKLDLPTSLAGKKVLDIGASDGYFSLELHKRGANVTALDYRDKSVSGFSTMETINDVKIRHVVASVYDIDSSFGEFDIVLHLGVIYHLPDIPASLWRARQVCKGVIFLESYVEDFNTNKPMARYYEADTLVGDASNFWAPNAECMEAMLRDAGFVTQKTHRWGDRAMVVAEATGSAKKIEIAYGKVMPSP